MSADSRPLQNASKIEGSEIPLITQDNILTTRIISLKDALLNKKSLLERTGTYISHYLIELIGRKCVIMSQENELFRCFRDKIMADYGINASVFLHV